MFSFTATIHLNVVVKIKCLPGALAVLGLFLQGLLSALVLTLKVTNATV